MTKLEALTKCAQMWDWLAEYPGKGKWEALETLWPGKKYPLHGCFACEYAKTVTIVNCTKCPMWKYEGEPFMCEQNAFSEYARWVNTRLSDDYEQNAVYAKSIADLARQRIKEIENASSDQ